MPPDGRPGAVSWVYYQGMPAEQRAWYPAKGLSIGGAVVFGRGQRTDAVPPSHPNDSATGAVRQPRPALLSGIPGAESASGERRRSRIMRTTPLLPGEHSAPIRGTVMLQPDASAYQMPQPGERRRSRSCQADTHASGMPGA